MTYSTPSERWSSGLRRFFDLRPMDGLRLARATWIAALAVYGVNLLMGVAAIPAAIAGLHGQDQTSLIVFLVLPILIRLLEPVLWLLVIRLVIEVCHVLLRRNPGNADPRG